MSKKEVFSKEDYHSNDGFLTYVWGPSMWMTLHIVSMNYPCRPTTLQKQQYKHFFDSIRHVLPCGACRENLKENLKSTGYNMSVFKNRDTLSRWVYDLHCSVNTMLGKKNVVTFDDVRNIYENFRARCSLKSPQRGGNHAVSSSKTLKKRKESGCTMPLTGLKSQCVLNIVPLCKNTPTLKIHKKCLCRRNSQKL